MKMAELVAVGFICIASSWMSPRGVSWWQFADHDGVMCCTRSLMHSNFATST